MSKFYIDATAYGRNDIDITPNDFRDGSEFGQYTKSIADEITAHPGATVRELLHVPCPHQDGAYWLRSRGRQIRTIRCLNGACATQ